MGRIEKVGEALASLESAVADAQKAIKRLNDIVREYNRPGNFSEIKDGECFRYRGIDFVRLGKEQGGVLCMTSRPIAVEAFDPNGCNNWAKSRARKKLNTEFLSLMDENDLLPFESDLTADNGDTAYGKCVDKIGILSCDLYRKYRDIIPLFDEWMWTCTPWYCGTPNSENAHSVRRVRSDGTLFSSGAGNAHGIVPACIFKL